MREIGVLRALAFSIPQLRAIFLPEGAALAAPGAVVGMGAALAYGGFIMLGLRTWWIDAVGTRLLSLHASIASLAMGAAAGMVTGLGSIAWTLRGLKPVTPRGLLAGVERRQSERPPLLIGMIAAGMAVSPPPAAIAPKLGPTPRLFGAGTLLLD